MWLPTREAQVHHNKDPAQQKNLNKEQKLDRALSGYQMCTFNVLESLWMWQVSGKGKRGGETGGILQGTFLYPTEIGVNEAEIHPAHKNPTRALISNMG